MDFVAIRRYDNYIPAHIDRGRLEEDGINCWLKDENTVTMNPVWTQAVGGIKLMVAKPQVERALNILTELEKEYKKTIACPACGSHNIELVSTPRKAINWISAISTFFLGDYALSVDKVNHCFDCGHEFPVDKEKQSPADDLTDN